jgi:hypothetical protein
MSAANIRRHLIRASEEFHINSDVFDEFGVQAADDQHVLPHAKWRVLEVCYYPLYTRGCCSLHVTVVRGFPRATVPCRRRRTRRRCCCDGRSLCLATAPCCCCCCRRRRHRCWRSCRAAWAAARGTPRSSRRRWTRTMTMRRCCCDAAPAVCLSLSVCLPVSLPLSLSHALTTLVEDRYIPSMVIQPLPSGIDDTWHRWLSSDR